MKKIFIPFLGIHLFILSTMKAQSDEEKVIINLSDQIFAWEVADKFDALEDIFHDLFIVMGSDGAAQTKREYIALLRSGNFIHNDRGV
tara:strand:- start:44839 stop:45102 length:264 start_codon:yes stop_codon:yes gene_type:complete